METYFDTSLLLKCYLPEPGTAAALAILRQRQPPFPLSHLLELELRTAIRIKHGRGEITAKEMRGVLRALESDMAQGVLSRPDYDLEATYALAESLSSRHAARTLARTADIWHVAAALAMGCKAFASYDDRQRALASRAGLELLPPAPARAKA